MSGIERICNSRADLDRLRSNKLFEALKKVTLIMGRRQECEFKQRPEQMDGHQQQDLPFLSSHPGPVTVTLDIDADILAFLQEKPFWRREINDLLRFYMETHLIREAAFEEAAAPEPQEDF